MFFDNTSLKEGSLMNICATKQYVAILIVAVVCGILPLQVDSYAQSNVQKARGIPVVNIYGKNRLLREILWEVSKQSGYKIEIGESLLDQKVNGRYVDATIDNFFHRLLKGRDVFQVVDPDQKIIKIHSTARKNERALVVKAVADNQGSAEDRWADNGLDGEPDKTYENLIQAQAAVFKNYNPAEHVLDGEPGKTTQDLLDEKAAVFAEYNPARIALDGEPGKMSGDLLKARAAVFRRYDPAKQALDNDPAKTDKDLLDERAAVFAAYDPARQPLDGQPEKTWQNLLDERDQVFSKRR